MTIVELLVVMVLLVALASVSMPAVRDILQVHRLRTASNDLFLSLMLTRSEAIKRNGRSVVCKSQSGVRCDKSGDWSQGWIVFADPNDNAQVDPGEAVVMRQAAVDAGLSVRGNTNVARYVSYTSLGTTNLVHGAFQAGTITVCTKSTGPTEARQIVISNVGRARVVKKKLPSCPQP